MNKARLSSMRQQIAYNMKKGVEWGIFSKTCDKIWIGSGAIPLFDIHRAILDEIIKEDGNE